MTSLLNQGLDSHRVIWITGLSGAGKSTLARIITSRLQGTGHPAVMLDGDDLREIFGFTDVTQNHHERESRLTLALRYAKLCRIISQQGVNVVIATISMFHEVHAWNRQNLPGYFEIYLKVPVAELRRRDPKGIYRRYDAGEITSVAGLDLEVDEPEAPDWLAEHSPGEGPESLADRILDSFQYGART